MKRTLPQKTYNNHYEEECDAGKFTGDLLFILMSRMALVIAFFTLVLSPFIGWKNSEASSSISMNDPNIVQVTDYSPIDSIIEPGIEESNVSKASKPIMDLGAGLAVAMLEMVVFGPK